jgi:peptide/nickel transport system substrate-binding protein
VTYRTGYLLEVIELEFRVLREKKRGDPMRSSRSRLITLVLFVSMVVLAACGTPATEAPTEEPTEAPTEAPAEATEAPAAEPTEEPTEPPTEEEEEEILVVGKTHELTTLDPARAYTPFSGMIHRAVYDTLVTFGAGDISELEPNLAESWDISDDGTEYTFELRQGVPFQSGNEMTAADVKWSWERVMGIKGNPYHLFEGIEAIETDGDYTVTIVLKEPDPAFLTKIADFSFSVLDSETVKEHGGVSGPEAEEEDQAQEWLDQNSAGTGPFSLESWELESEITVVKFPDSWRGTADIEKVVYRHMPETAARKIALQAGDLDIALGLTAEQATSLSENPDVNIVTGPGLETFFLLCNRNPELSDGLMSNPLVPRAMRYAIDREGLKMLAGYDATSPATVIPMGLFGAWDESKTPERDIERAKELLAEAGYPDGFEFDLRYPTEFSSSGVDFDIIAEKVQADLAEAGIQVNLKPEELMANLEEYRAGNLAFTFWVWMPDYPDINDYIEFLPAGIVGNRAQWSEERANEEILALRDEAAEATEPQARAEVWGEIQQYMVENGPYVNLVQASLQIGLGSDIEGYVYNQVWLLDPFLISK